MSEKSFLFDSKQKIKKRIRRLLGRSSRKARGVNTVKLLVRDAKALEIGGPSKMFTRRGALPVYPYLSKLDNCNFSEDTIWDTDAKSNVLVNTSFGDTTVNFQYCLEADDLSEIKTEQYDVVLNSHVIEHVANPLKALEEWYRVLKPSGILILIVPHRKGTFDHNRPVTLFNHLIEDYQKSVGPDDLTHLPEVLDLHDINLDTGATDFQELAQE